jgi:diacylglycerol kinase family enzyme
MRVVAVINKGGGTSAAVGDALEERVASAFVGAGIDAAIRLVAPSGLPDAMEKAAAEHGPDALIAGGGDGTIGLAAAAAVRHGRVLGILPLGTLNHLARDAGIPGDIDGAVAVIAAGHKQAIDVASVNGHIFVNNSGVGLYPMMVRSRQAQQRLLRRSKRIAMLVASVRALRHFSRYRLTIVTEDGRQAIETPLLFVGNNRYETSLLTLGRRQRLDQGSLCIYAMLARTRIQMLGIALRGLFGQMDQRQDFVMLDDIGEAEIAARAPSLTVSADGETMRLDTPLRYRILPRTLTLLMPAPPEQAAGPLPK